MNQLPSKQKTNLYVERVAPPWIDFTLFFKPTNQTPDANEDPQLTFDTRSAYHSNRLHIKLRQALNIENTQSKKLFKSILLY